MIAEKQQKYSLIIALFQLVMALVVIGLWLKYEESLPTTYLVQVGSTLIVGFLVSFLSWRHNALSWRSFVEKRERSLSEQKKNIFEDDTDFAGRYEKAFTQFNKALLPFVLIIISVVEAFLSLRIFWQTAPEIVPGEATLLVPVAILFSLSLISFLAGKFSAGLAHNEGHSFLRPVCGYLLYNSFTMFAAAVCALFYHFQVEPPLGIFINCSIVFSTALAIERLLLWGVDMYRPKSKTEEYLPIYESRILALFSQPKGVLGNLATMLEYQFGVKISESLFSSFLKKAFLPYLCIQLLSLFLLSSITYIKPHENGLRMTWGDHEFSLLEPGLYLTAPWPIAKIERYDVQRVKEINLTESPEFKQNQLKLGVDTWDLTAYDKLLNMCAQKEKGSGYSQNLVVVNAKLSYRISNLLKYRRAYINSEDALRVVGKEALSRILLESNFEEVLKGGLGEFTVRLKGALSKVLEEELGIELVDISIVNFQPPSKVATVYESVYNAQEEKARLILEAEKDNVIQLRKFEIRADKMLKETASKTTLKRKLLEKELEVFEAQKEIYRKLPVLYRAIARMNTIENVLGDVRKVVNLTGVDKEIIILELKKSTPDLLELE